MTVLLLCAAVLVGPASARDPVTIALRDDWVTSFDRDTVAPLLDEFTTDIERCLRKSRVTTLQASIKIRFKTNGQGRTLAAGIDGAPDQKAMKCLQKSAAAWVAPGRGTLTAVWE